MRDWQRHAHQYTPGKNFIGTGAFGPWMVTADEIPDPYALKLTTRLNGQVMQDAGINLMIFNIETVINYISTFTELVPGDVIVTGTPGGVGNARKPPSLYAERRHRRGGDHQHRHPAQSDRQGSLSRSVSAKLQYKHA